MAGTDVTVVGAGLYGSSLACALAREGMSVRLCERRSPTAGDTGRSFGMVRRHYSNAVTVSLAKRGCELLMSDRESAYVPTGYLLTVSPAQRAACEGNVALGQSLGVDTRLLEPDELAAVEPLIDTEGIGCGAHEPDGGLVDASRYTLARFAEAVSLGVDVSMGAEAELPDDGSIVVVAAGCWSKQLLPELPVELHRIEIAVLRDAPVRAVVSDAVTNVVTRPVAGGGAWVVTYGGSTQYAQRDDCDGEPDPAYRDAVRSSLASRYPSIAGATYAGGWSGAYDVTPDWNPVVGWVRDRVFAVAGLSGHGLKLAPAIAESAAAVIAGREPRIDLRPLRFERFAEGDLLRLAYGPGARA
ncbi:MAG TPA: FAD-dependent oxidoreductase [Gaiellales bacterium]|nr:FAD-dependent oxidoreductase [Gaiellales bacterium]